MDVRLTVSVAAMLALSANVSAAPTSIIISQFITAQTPIQLAADCIRYSQGKFHVHRGRLSMPPSHT
jgi:hypothetical protein